MNSPPPSSRSGPRVSALAWSQALPQAAAAWLVAEAGWTGAGPLDLSTWWIVVPTRQSGRRLREALAQGAAERGQAVFSPQVVVPSQVPEALAPSARTAGRLDSLLAWVKVLRETPPEAMRALVPIDPPQRDFAWGLGLARRLQRVQGQLTEEGLTLAAAAEHPGNLESGRWQQLAELEARWEAALGEVGLNARPRVEAAGLAEVQVPTGVERVAVLGVPDALGVAVSYLERLAAAVAVDVLVYADPARLPLAEAFDAWGRPRPEFWADRELPWQDFETQVRLEANPAAQAARITALAARHERPDEWLAVAVVDPEVRAPLEQELAAAGQHSFNPEGVPWTQGRLHGLLGKLAALVERADHLVVGDLLRHPDVLAYLLAADQAGPAQAAAVLRAWDQLRDRQLVADLPSALARAGEWPVLQRALGQIAAWREQLRAGAFADGALAVPGEILGHSEIASGSPLAEAARHWVETVEQIATGPFVTGDALDRAEQWRLALQVFGEGARFETKPVDALELGGWLELLWADAEQAVIAGVNEGLLPEAVVGDAFLPESLRVTLGLRSNAHRLARDAYLLTAVMASRRGEHVELLVGKTAENGEPLRPSRLLLAGNDAVLPARVQRLFRPLEVTSANLPWRRAWPLHPARQAAKPEVSVTALRDWLECPFRFYLKRVLRMEPIDLRKGELDARDFGTLLHTALEAMSEKPGLKDCTDEAVLRDGVLQVFDAEAVRLFGAEPALPLVIQLESGRQRLRRVAAIEVAERLDGWQTERVEWSFAVPLGPLTVRGKIDRIDRHADGRVRVIDYKTSDKPKAPLDAHLATLRAGDADRPEWLQVELGGKARRWVDLQLPLYRRALAADYGTALTCAYFNLPKAVAETGLLTWPEEDAGLQASAERCAEAVAAAIAGGQFWPPVEDFTWDPGEWATVFHHGVAASVAEEWIRAGNEEGGG